MAKKQRVFLGFSGGIDSTYAALSLMAQGYHVETITMKMLDASFLCYEKEKAMLSRARNLSSQLGLCHHEIDCREIFQHRVHEPFIQGYLKGHTPNPCILCNRHLKFGHLFDWAMAQGADFYATGHYGMIKEEGQEFALLRPCCVEKDQSYYLSAISRQHLKKILFPLGGVSSKEEVNKAVLTKGFSFHAQRESMGICFVPKGKVGPYIKACHPSAQEGYFVDETGKIAGRHLGIFHYTIGQKVILKGDKKYVVHRIDGNTHRIYLGGEESLFHRHARLKAIVFSGPKEALKKALRAQINPFGKAYGARFEEGQKGRGTIYFDTPVRGLQRGQAVTLYLGPQVVVGGIIEDFY